MMRRSVCRRPEIHNIGERGLAEQCDADFA